MELGDQIPHDMSDRVGIQQKQDSSSFVSYILTSDDKQAQRTLSKVAYHAVAMIGTEMKLKRPQRKT